MECDLKLEKDGAKGVLYKYRGLIFSGHQYEWRNRTALLQSWLDGSDDGEFKEILENIPAILKESEFLTLGHKLLIADWVIDALIRERLIPKWEDVLHETVHTLLTLLFKELIPSQNVGSVSKELQNELHYTLRRWFTLVKDSQRSWFERKEYPREQALRDTLFKAGTIYPFYVLPGFPELEKTLRVGFLPTMTLLPAPRSTPHCIA